MIDYLKRTYGDNLLVQNGQTYPVYAFPANGETLDSILDSHVPDTFDDPSQYPVYHQAHLDHLKATKPGLHNGITFNMQQFTQNPLRITGNLGHYFDMLATCDALDQELRAYSRGEIESLPLREQFHSQIPTEMVIKSGVGRSAVIGVATLTVFNDQGQYKFILAQRAQTLGVGAGLFHIVPAFVFQPSGPEEFYAAEWSLKHQMLREYGEELFGMPEYPEWDKATTVDYFYEHPAVKDLRQMITDGRASLHLTGVAFNPLTLRIEIGTMILIQDPSWFIRSKTALDAALLTERQHTYYISLDTLDGLPDDLPTRMAPHGAASMWLGILHAQKLLKW